METIKRSEAVTNKIGELHAQGYDRLHLPGGTAKDGSFYVGGICHRLIEKEVEILVVPYNSNFHLKGESGHNKKSGEIVEDALVRETLEETGLQIIPSALKLLIEKKIPDNRPGKVGQFHTKYFYLVSGFTGNLFTFDGPNPIDGETAAPLWVPASMILNLIFGGHKKAVEKAMEELSLQSREYAIALMNVL